MPGRGPGSDPQQTTRPRVMAMNERVMQFRVGVMVIATLVITGILVLLFDGLPQLGGKPYLVYVALPQAPGVTPGTPIRKSGILIGRVSDVEFAEDRGLPQFAGGVIVTCEIDGTRKLKHNEIAQIGKSLLGDAFLEFVILEDPKHDKSPVQPEEVLAGRLAADPFTAIGNLEQGLTLAVASVTQTSDEIGLLARRFNDLLSANDEQLMRIVGKAEGALDQLQIAARNADTLLSDPKLRANIQQVAENLPQTLDNMTEALAQMKQTFQTADRNLQNIEGLTKPLGERGTRLFESLDGATAKLDRVLTELDTFAQSLNGSEGTVGQLLRDPTLYEELSATVDNLSSLSRELRPVVRDARVFSDKIARHPELLGVRGAIQRSTGTK